MQLNLQFSTVTDFIYKLKTELNFNIEFIFKNIKSRSVYIDFEETKELFVDIIDKIKFESKDKGIILIEMNEVGNKLEFIIDAKLDLSTSKIPLSVNEFNNYQIKFYRICLFMICSLSKGFFVKSFLLFWASIVVADLFGILGWQKDPII